MEIKIIYYQELDYFLLIFQLIFKALITSFFKT